MGFLHPLVIVQVYSGPIFYSDILYATASLLTCRLFENTLSNKAKGRKYECLVDKDLEGAVCDVF